MKTTGSLRRTALGVIASLASLIGTIPAAAQTADEIIDKYVTAVGGAPTLAGARQVNNARPSSTCP